MRIVVYGAGAIGGVLGGRLFQNGGDVVLIARGPHYEAMRAHGLRIETPAGHDVVEVPVVDDPGALTWGDDDIVVLAMKTQDMEGALAALDAAGAAGVPVACAQNGVESERLALRRRADVYGVCVMCPAAHLRPGVVQAFSLPSPGILDVGRYPEGTDARAEALAAAFRTATFHAEARADIMRWKYTKLLMNVGNAGRGVVPGRRPGAARSPPGPGAEGDGRPRPPPASPSCPTRRFVERRGDLIAPQAIGGGPRPGGSSWQSLERGTGSHRSGLSER